MGLHVERMNGLSDQFYGIVGTDFMALSGRRVRKN